VAVVVGGRGGGGRVCGGRQSGAAPLQQLNDRRRLLDPHLTTDSPLLPLRARSYGDPVDAYGDLKAMAEAAAMLKPGGHLFLAVPRGSDAVVWNAHRIFGPIRFPMLINGWRIVDAEDARVLAEVPTLTGDREAQPVYLLTPQARFTNYARNND
jgi:hypothetical protein